MTNVKNRNAFGTWVAALLVALLAIGGCKSDRFGAVVDSSGGQKFNASGIDANNHPVFNVPAPTATTHATNKSYVDTAVAGVTANLLDVRVASTANFPSYVYANGTSGVGATITASANAACPTVDGVAPQVGDTILFQHGASFSDNGVYTFTALGDGSTTPCVMTRDTRADSAAEILSKTISVREGNSRGGGLYRYVNSPTITMGTTALAWLRVDGARTENEVAVFNEDFERFGQQAFTTATYAPGTGFVSTFTGSNAGFTGAAPSTATERGVVTATTGTTATGNASFTLEATTSKSVVVDAAQYLAVEFRVGGVSAASDGTNTYTLQFGLGSTTGTGSTDGVIANYDQTASALWRFYNRTSSTNSTVQTGATVSTTQSTYTRIKFVKYAGETTTHVFQDGVEQGTGITTQFPVGVALTPLMTIVKTAGTTAVTQRWDYYRLLQGWPKGRG